MSQRTAKVVKKTPVQDLLGRIVEETDKFSALTRDQRQATLRPGQIIPHMIVVGKRAIPTSNAAAQDIAKLATALRTGPYSYTSDPNQFFVDTSGAIGELLIELRTTGTLPDDWLGHAAARFEELLKARVNQGRRTLTEIVPCDVFDEDQKVGPFDVGPVAFLPREVWLERLPDSPRANYVREVFSGARTLASLKEALETARNDDKMALIEAADLVRHIDGRPWIATVTLLSHDPIRSHANGVLLVELALDFLSLLMDTTSGRRLSHPGIAGPLIETKLALGDDDTMFSSWKFNKKGVGAPPNAANELLASQAAIIGDVGEILSAYLNGSVAGHISPLVERWVGALHWYGMALRDPNEFAALCDYGDVLDVLTRSGGNGKTMAEYLGVALGIDEVTNKDEYKKLGDMVERIYSDGRSQLRHGEKIGLMRDFSAELAQANYLVQLGLLAVAEHLADFVRTKNQVLTLDPSQERRAIMALMKGRIERIREERRKAEASAQEQTPSG